MKNQWLENGQKWGTPIIDDRWATFIWQGKNPPLIVGDFNNWSRDENLNFEAQGEDVWVASLELPLDAYMEYAFWDGDQRRTDPLNRRKIRNIEGWNSFFYMPEGRKTTLVNKRKGVAQGKLTSETISTGSYALRPMLSTEKRRVYFYQPPVEQPVPLLVVFDGKEYLQRVRLPTLIENMVVQGRMAPIALAMVENAGKLRFMEYLTNEATVGFLNEYLIPAAQKRLNLVDLKQTPGAYGLLGASMGGLISLYGGIRMPHIFGKVLAQSGAYTLDDLDSLVWNLIRWQEKLPVKIWMDAGKFEWLLDCNRRMAKLLVEKGYEVAYHEFNGYHNYPVWRDDLWRGLEWLFGKGS